MNTFLVITLFCGLPVFAQERKNTYIIKPNSPEIQMLQKRQYLQKRAREDIRSIVQLAPVIVGGSYCIFDLLSRVHGARKNNIYLPQADEYECFKNYLESVAFLALGICSIINTCATSDCSRGCHLLSRDYVDIWKEESCQIFNYVSCNAVYELIKLAERKLTR